MLENETISILGPIVSQKKIENFKGGFTINQIINDNQRQSIIPKINLINFQSYLGVTSIHQSIIEKDLYYLKGKMKTSLLQLSLRKL